MFRFLFAPLSHVSALLDALFPAAWGSHQLDLNFRL
jgi:hypothetical protein